MQRTIVSPPSRRPLILFVVGSPASSYLHLRQVDLHSMACPVKFMSMNSFYKYYSGEKVAPLPTIFVGGNHEASNHLQELYHGGWVAPNIFYLGSSGVVNFRGVRIAGISGIYKPGDYRKGVYERMPYDKGSIRSVFHTRELDAFKLSQVSDASFAVLSRKRTVATGCCLTAASS